MAETKGGAGDGQDPIAAMADGAKAVRQLHVSYVLAGFNEAQALYLVGLILSVVTRAATAPPGGGGDG